ncbi:hypothetical protein BB561_003107 [Smittium simulii]|uniref:Cyclopropane-fatty-acyl-phospholipid synthase n=1 Tax=Smittium simulii TaxID=133385 RepID=A0A2T9YMY8_9FUNG|nr:hypothetical protein BB561_003107 [Smittium simulii]
MLPTGLTIEAENRKNISSSNHSDEIKQKVNTSLSLKTFLDTINYYIKKKARENFYSALQFIDIGEIHIIDENGTERIFGNSKNSDIKSKITIKNSNFWLQLGCKAKIGIAESYINREIDIENLVGFFEIYILNREHLSTHFSSLKSAIYSFIIKTTISSLNSISDNAKIHYNMGNETFGMFLDETMSYSCGIWNSPSDSLYVSQINKYNQIIKLLGIRSCDRVAEQTGCKVVGLTVSEEQLKMANKRINKNNKDRVLYIICDILKYNSEHAFDKIVSIEMFEHLGIKNFIPFFKKCNELLDKQTGLMYLQTSAMCEQYYDTYKNSCDFISQYIFPGGHLPALSSIAKAIKDATRGSLSIERVDNTPEHYARTLQEWRLEFIKNYNKIKAEKSNSNLFEGKNKGVGLGIETNNTKDNQIFDKSFKNKMEYYFAYCESGFKTRTLSLLQIVITRSLNPMLNGSEFYSKKYL